MISIRGESGRVLKVLPWQPGKQVHFHPRFGFVSEDAVAARANNRRRHGFKNDDLEYGFSFEMNGEPGSSAILANARNCTFEETESGWRVNFGKQNYHVASSAENMLPGMLEAQPEERDRWWMIFTLVALLIPFVVYMLPHSPTQIAAPVVVDQTVVQLKQPEVQKPVEVKNAIDKMPELAKVAPQMKKAIQQDLGFLGASGKKFLKNAAGGVPTQLKDASAGAGAGGMQGSGGETLVGLGAGLKRTTVGNSGVAGLGGVGTRGAGGGAGGYGDSAIGSGSGTRLAGNQLAQEATIEGGLDRAVIEATIAKYLSQVRACYEEGLRRDSSLVGQVTMSFEINGTGAINYARVKSTTLNDAPVESCISQKMKYWQFPQPRGGVLVKANHPFALRPTQL